MIDTPIPSKISWMYNELKPDTAGADAGGV
jgi:hypothetical protein